jgi:hypothetical protein
VLPIYKISTIHTQVLQDSLHRCVSNRRNCPYKMLLGIRS